MTIIQLSDTYYEASFNITDVGNILTSAAGTAFTVILVYAILGAYAKKDWGLLIIEVIGAVVCAFFVLDPSDGEAFLLDIAKTVFLHK